MDKYEELEKIQKLKEKGTITEDEFEVEKNNILNNEENNKKTNNNGIYITTFILGLLTFFSGIIPILGTILGIIALIIGIIANRKKKEKKGIVIAGIVLSIIGIIVNIVFTFTAIRVYNYNNYNRNMAEIRDIDEEQQEILAYNSKYEFYCNKDITFDNVEYLITLIRVNNMLDNKMYLKYKSQNYSTGSELTNLTNKLSSNKTYTAKILSYYNNGYIKTIEIKEK